MATTREYPSIWTGSQVDDSIKVVRDNWDAFSKLTLNLGRIEDLENALNDEKNGVNTRITEIQRTLWDPSYNIHNGKVYNFLPITGGSMSQSAQIDCTRTGGDYNTAHQKAILNFREPNGGYNGYLPYYSYATQKGYITCGMKYGSENAIEWRLRPYGDSVSIDNEDYLSKITDDGVMLGAAWNDYAEFRKSDEVVCENGDGSLSRSTKRLQPGAEIISDTFGFAIGKTQECKTPIAVSGRVLAYPYEDWWCFEPGQPVCAGPNGTVSMMSRREVRKYPDRIIGTVSELPSYETWGKHKTPVNGRIWIKVK